MWCHCGGQRISLPTKGLTGKPSKPGNIILLPLILFVGLLLLKIELRVPDANSARDIIHIRMGITIHILVTITLTLLIIIHTVLIGDRQ